MESSLETNKIVKPCFAILLLSILFLSCNQETHFVKTHYYSTGELLSEIPYRIKDSLKDGAYKEYYKNGNIKQIILLKEGKAIDSAMQYYESGELKFKEMRKKDTIHTFFFYKSGDVSVTSQFLNTDVPIEIGWSKIFTRKGDLSDSLQYINLNGNGFLNQRYHFDQDRNTVLDSSYFYNFKISKIENSDNFHLKIDYTPSIKNSQVFMVVGENINTDFSNLKEMQLDTLFMENNTLFTNSLKNPYRKLKGYFYEYNASINDTVNNDSVRMTIREKKTFFNEYIMVTDTILHGGN